MRRRKAIQGGMAALLTSSLPGTANALSIPLEKLDPFGPPEFYFKYLRHIIFDPKKSRPYMAAIWRRYERKRERIWGERATVGMYLIWRMEKTRADRIRTARIAQKMAENLRKHFPDFAGGYVWIAAFFGAEAMARGAMNSLHLAPEILKRIAIADKIDPTYYYGLARLLKAKLLVKAPRFPISVGNIDKGYALLREVEPLQRKRFATWYLFLAEAEYILGNKKAALALLDDMAREIKPQDAASAYILDTSLYDAQDFRKVIADGTYDRYRWDPMLTPAHSGLPT